MKPTRLMTLGLIIAIFAGSATLCLQSRVLHADSESFEDGYRDWKNRPVEHFTEAEKNFQKAKAEILSHYVDDKLTEEQLYQFAVEGMLAGLNPNQKSWNKLYSPTELKELKEDMAGKVVGAGVEIKFDSESGITDVLSVIPGTPAEKAGIVAGDKILKVQGRAFKGMNLRDVVYAIRGRIGESIPLTVLHGDKVFTRTIRRENVPWSSVESTRLPDDILLVSIREFTETTPSMLKQALAELSRHPAKGLLIDLRQNSGGLFDKMLESLSLLVPDGTPVATAVHRGGREEKISTRGKPMVTGVRIAVLVNRDTACGAEMMAKGLKTGADAVLIGNHTFGKWNSQTVEEFPNHFAMKYTVAIFDGPRGEKLDGVGIEPDINVDLGSGKVLEGIRRIREPAQRIGQDEPLRAAVGIVKLKQG